MSDIKLDFKIKETLEKPTAEAFLKKCKELKDGETVIAMTALYCLQFYVTKIGNKVDYRLALLAKHSFKLERELSFKVLNNFMPGGADSYIINGRKILGLL